MNAEQLFDEGVALHDDGKYESAIGRYMEAKEISESEGDDRQTALLEMEIAMSSEELGWLDDALTNYKSAKAGLDRFGEDRDRASVAFNYGSLVHQLGHRDGGEDEIARAHGGALGLYRLAMKLCPLEDGELLAGATFNIANVHNCQGLVGEALVGWSDALDIYVALDLPVKIADVAFAVGDATQYQGHYAEGADHLRAASTIYREQGQIVKANRVDRSIAHALHHQGEFDQAERLLRRCLSVFDDYRESRDLMNAWSDLAFTLSAQGRHQEAVDALNRARWIAEEASLSWDMAAHDELISGFEAGVAEVHEHPEVTEASRYGEGFRVALDLVTNVHGEQRRKSDEGETPGPFYLGHLLGTAALVIEDGGSEAEAIAALLHDVVEDTVISVSDIRAIFGDEVATIVDGCTDAHEVPKPPWRERKEGYIQDLTDASPAVLRVSSADKLYNARTIVADLRDIGSTVWERFTKGKESQLWYYRALADSYLEHNPGRLADELNRVVTQMEELSEVS